MRLTTSYTPFTFQPPVIIDTAVVQGLLVITALLFAPLLHEFHIVPHDHICAGRGGEVLFCGITVAAQQLQESCKSLVLQYL